MPEEMTLLDDEFSSFQVEDWRLVPYQIAIDRQLALVERVKAGDIKDTVVFCTHPPVVTLGRASKPEDITEWTGEVHKTSRGGRATYHGPSQVVIYPILALNRNTREHLHHKDVHAYLRCLESSLVRVLKTYGLKPEVKPAAGAEEESLNMTGVWVGDRKVASIGVAVRSWVTYHGIALNVDKASEAFKGIKPCGFSQDTMVSMEELLGYPVDREDLKHRLLDAFSHYFS